MEDIAARLPMSLRGKLAHGLKALDVSVVEKAGGASLDAPAVDAEAGAVRGTAVGDRGSVP
ncbi:hypothetical protein BEH93_07405 [Streptomyces sp. 2R]|nr:hypothetical protein BEH93_07405 [Streptomyces sp. 2R]